MSFDDKQIPKCSTKEEINKFFATHAECDLNSEKYPDGIQLIFCRTHSKYQNGDYHRPDGSYVFMRPPEHQTEEEDEEELEEKRIDLYESDYVDIWFHKGLLYLRISVNTIQLDKELAEQVLIGMTNSNEKMNEMNLKLQDFDDYGA